MKNQKGNKNNAQGGKALRVQTVDKPLGCIEEAAAPSIVIRRGRNARKIIQWMIFSGGRAAAQGVYVAGGRSARKMIQWIIFSEGRAAAQGRRLKAASAINFWP